MPNGKSDIMAQAVYLAQLEAANGKCKCRACQVLRKASKVMTDQFLAGNAANPGGKSARVLDPTATAGEVINLGEDEE